jgi:SOS-response transcriptional repressor LexA
MHVIQEKILKLLEKKGTLKNWTLRSLGEMVGDPDSPQRIKHHLTALQKHGFLVFSKSSGELSLSSFARKKQVVLFRFLYLDLPIVEKHSNWLKTSRQRAFYGSQRVLLGLCPKSRSIVFFVVRAVGSSMNRADIAGDAIDDGDYVVVDRQVGDKKSLHGKYVLSLIDGAANIKKFVLQAKSDMITLVSESSQNFSPIFIHQDDFADYTVAGRIVRVLKKTA